MSDFQDLMAGVKKRAYRESVPDAVGGFDKLLDRFA
jgi:hypothetical protein